jgi:hypothetical protein
LYRATHEEGIQQELIMLKTNGLLIASALALFIGSGLAAAQDDENKGRTAGGERGGKATKTLVICDGGAQEAVITNTENAPASSVSAAFVAIPGTTIPGFASGPAGDADTYTVTLSGEASATSGGSWLAQAQVSVNGGAFVDIDPIGPNTFHSKNPAYTHTMTWCKRLVATSSATFRIVWAKIGGGSAVLDDYTMRVERSN